MLKSKGIETIQLDLNDLVALVASCKGADCVVSALAGLHEVIFDTQKKLIDAAALVGVPRFIPSDFSTDFTPLTYGKNRNLDARKDFHGYINTQKI